MALKPTPELPPLFSSIFDSCSTTAMRFHDIISEPLLTESTALIQKHISQCGISFEGRGFNVSLQPTVISEADLTHTVTLAALVRQALCTVIQKFLEEHRLGNHKSPIHRAFQPYEQWWDLIGSEHRRSTPIGLLRFDSIRSATGSWHILETNTACPSLTINCARSREAWSQTRLAQQLMQGLSIREYQNDDPYGFARFLAQKANTLSLNGKRNIALCSYKGLFYNELSALQAAHVDLVANGEIAPSEVIICDIREIAVKGNQVFAAGQPVTLIHNKVDQLIIDPQDSEIAGWRRAAASDHVEFLNSLGALYLTEAKRVLAVLSDPDLQQYLNLDATTIHAITTLVPPTRILPPPSEPSASAVHRLVQISQPQLVLKADALTRGQGIVLGPDVTSEIWRDAIGKTVANNGVAQAYVPVPRRLNYRLCDQGRMETFTEFYGIDLLFFDDSFGGAVSRSHTDIVFNVGNGGSVAPTLVLKE